MSQETLALASIFIKKFPYGAISIDDFDTFIITNGMATDPETDDTKSTVYRGFIKERASAKRTLNSAASNLPDSAFMIRVKKPGELYEICRWSDGADEELGSVGNVIKRYTINKTAGLSTLRATAQRLMVSDPTDTSYQEAYQVLALVESEGKMLSARVNAMTSHYEVGVDAARAYAQQRLQEAPTDAMLELPIPQ